MPTYNEDYDAIRALLDEEDYGIWKKCPFCDRQFPNFAAWNAHLRRDHKDKLEPQKPTGSEVQ